MNQSITPLLVFIAGTIWLTPLARADDTRDNPNYQVWSKFKPGSTSTVSADLRDGQDNIHVETTRTLVSITADQVVIHKVSTATQKGHIKTQAPVTETIPAKTTKDEIKETGHKDVDAMGKTFNCRVWDSTTAPPKANTGPGAKPAPGDGVKATIYISDDVPGGIVRLDGTGPNGQSLVFVLTKFETK